jgi:hypothetical protein
MSLGETMFDSLQYQLVIDEGKKAYNCWKQLSDNPHVPGTDSRILWEIGWQEAYDEYNKIPA